MSEQEIDTSDPGPSSQQAPDKEDTFSKRVLSRINTLRHHRKLCDVTLRVCDSDGQATEIRTHRAVLAACSAYFLAMFTHEVKESQQDVVDIQGVKPDIMTGLVDFTYTGEIDINVNNVQEILAATSLLQLNEVQDLCCDFLREQLDASNCLGIRCFAEANGCPQLSSVIDKFARKNFVDVVQGTEFCDHSWEKIVLLIKSDELNVKEEEEVFEAVMKWVEYDIDERLQHLPKLLSHVRLPLLSIPYLMNSVDVNQHIKESVECRDLLDEAKRYHLLPTQRDDLNERMVPRYSTIGSLYAVGGKESSESITRSVECFTMLDCKWEQSREMVQRRQQLGAGVLEGKIYAVGGSDGSVRLNSVECYDPAHNSWSFVAPMNTCRSGVGVGVMGGAMYAAGGYDGRSCLKAVERFDLDKNIWCAVSQMNTRRSFPGVAILNGKLYVFGGNDGSSFLNVAEVYDPHINRWSLLTSLTKPRAGIGVAALDQRIFVAGGNDGTSRLDSVEFYDPRTDKWANSAKMLSARDGVCLATLGTKILAVGGINGPSYLRSTEMYDAVADKWEVSADMNTCRAAAGVALL